MPVVKITVNRLGASYNTDIISGTVTKQFVVEWDGAEDADWMVVHSRTATDGAISVPQPYDPHPADPWAYVNHVAVAPGDGPKQWIVNVTYKSWQNPLAAPPKVSWSFASSNEPIDRDIFDRAVTNSARETYDPPISEDVDDILLRITRNEAGYNPMVALDYKNSINSDVFYGAAPGIAKLKNFSGDLQLGGPSEWYVINYEVQFRLDGWKRRMLDQGFRTYDSATGEYTTIVDSKGKALSEPTLLDGNGNKLPNASIDSPVFNVHETKRSLPFAPLML